MTDMKNSKVTEPMNKADAFYSACLIGIFLISPLFLSALKDYLLSV